MHLNASARVLLISCVFLASLATAVLAPNRMRSISSNGEITYPVRIMRHVVSHSFQDVELAYIANNFDLFCCFPDHFGPKIREIKSLNPGIIALVYRNFRAIYETSDEYPTINKTWILRDSAGNIVRSTQWWENVMVDIGNEDYQDFVVNWIKKTLDQYGYDGVWFDNSIFLESHEAWFSVTASPINPRTGRQWTNAEIKQACIETHVKLKEAIGPNKFDVANGIFHGQRFRERYGEYLDFLANAPIDGLMSEGIWFTYKGEWFTTQEWMDSLNFLVWVNENFLNTTNKIFWINCEVTRGYLPPYCTYYQMIDYAFASSLLGVNRNGGNSFLALFPAYNDRYLFLNDYVKNLHGLSTGIPLNSYYQVDEKTTVFCRDFTNIKVLVNPTERAYTVNLGGNFETLNGDTVSVLDVNPHTGIILKRV